MCVLTDIIDHAIMSLNDSDPDTVLDNVNQIIEKENSFAKDDIEAIVNFLDAASDSQKKQVNEAPLDEREKLSEIFCEKSVKTVDHLVSQPLCGKSWP